MKSFKELLGGLEEARLFASYQDAAAAAGPGQKPKLDASSNKYILVREETISEAQVSTKKYSWGTMKTIHHGSDFSIPLHPEHHKEIAKLKDEQEHNFKTEDGKHWTARRKGDDVHFQGANNGGTTKVPHSAMKEGYDDNRRGFGKRPREDDEYHVPDPEVKNKVKKEEVELDEKLNVGGGAPVKGANGVVSNTPAKQTTSKPAAPAKKPMSSLEKLRARMDAARKVNEGRSDVVIHTTASSMDDNDHHITKLKEAGIFAQQGAGASHHIIVPREHEDTARKILAGHLKEAMNRQERDRAAEEQARRERVLKDNPRIAAEVERRRKAAEAAKAGTVKEQAPVAPVPDKKYIKGTPEHKAYKATKKPINGIPTGKYNEEVESLEEANHREFASQGKMHPDMAKHMTVGQHMDYYEPKTGDKVHGKVMHNNGKEVHVKQSHDSYDSKKVGTVHKFTVSTKLDEAVQKADIPAYLRKAKGEKPLELKDLKRKDTISDAENLAKNRGVKEQQEGTMKTYKEFVTEIKMSDLPRRSIKGSSYGAQYDDPEGADDADDKKPAKAADAPKRGRGRPAGSTSGARQQGSAKQSKSGVDYTGYKLHLPNSNK
jgi:hypothetical protein